MPSTKGVRRASWLGMVNCVYFIFRNKKLRCGVESTRYTIRINWRKHWYLDIPLGYNVAATLPTNLYYLTKPTKTYPSLSYSKLIKNFKFLEKFTLAQAIPTLNSYLCSLWASVFRGVGGINRLKVRFKGKSFKWHRRKNSLMLRFGHSHLVALSPYPGIRWKRFGRMKIILFGSNWWDLIEFAQAVCWWRPVNVYHGRGIRLKRQSILRKAGKVSAYR